MSNYDERLLESAPAATRAERQEGYNVDLLETPQKQTRSGTSSPTPPPVLASNIDHAENGHGAGVRDKEFFVPDRQTTPWYKTKKWIIIFVLLAIAALAAIIGGAVGGTLANKHDNKKDNSSAPTGDGSSGNGGSSGSPGGSGGEQGPESPAPSSAAPTGSSVVGGLPGGGGGGASSTSAFGFTLGGLSSGTSPTPTSSGGNGVVGGIGVALPTDMAAINGGSL